MNFTFPVKTVETQVGVLCVFLEGWVVYFFFLFQFHFFVCFCLGVVLFCLLS